MSKEFVIADIELEEFDDSPDPWTMDEYRKVLHEIDYDDPESISENELYDMLLMALDEAGFEESGKAVFKLIVKDKMTDGQIVNTVHKLDDERIWESYAEFGLHFKLYKASWLMYQAFPGSCSKPEYLRLTCKITADPESGKITDPKFNGTLGDLKEMWTHDLGLGFGGAVASKGEAFILDRDDNDQDIIKCIDILSGKIKWENKYKNPGRFGYPGSRSLPAVDENFVFTFGSIGDLVCTDRKTGKTVWRKDIKKVYNVEPPPWGFGQSPLLYKDTVIIAPMKNKGVVALKKNNGEIVWESAAMTTGKIGYSSPLDSIFYL